MTADRTLMSRFLGRMGDPRPRLLGRDGLLHLSAAALGGRG